MGDLSSSDYDGQGSYRMRVRRYTASGNSGSEDSSNSSVAITISAPTLTPTPTDTPKSINTPTPKPIPTNTPTPKVTPTPTQKPTPTILKEFIATSAGVLGESTQSSKIIQKSKKAEVFFGKDNTLLPKLLVLIGIVFLVVCAIVFFYPYIIKIITNNKYE